MASKITINSISGAAAPYTLYVCDGNGNNCTFLTTDASPTGDFTLSPFFNGSYLKGALKCFKQSLYKIDALT